MKKRKIINFLKEHEIMTEEVTQFNEDVQQIVDTLLMTLHASESVGLSAPQIGEKARIAVVDFQDGRDPLILINPVLTKYYGEETEMEGCLSYPDVYGEVTRPSAIQVEAQDRDGSIYEITAEGIEARVILHEMDHLVGAPFTKKIKRRVDVSQFNEEE